MINNYHNTSVLRFRSKINILTYICFKFKSFKRFSRVILLVWIFGHFGPYHFGPDWTLLRVFLIELIILRYKTSQNIVNLNMWYKRGRSGRYQNSGAEGSLARGQSVFSWGAEASWQRAEVYFPKGVEGGEMVGAEVSNPPRVYQYWNGTTSAPLAPFRKDTSVPCESNFGPFHYGQSEVFKAPGKWKKNLSRRIFYVQL